MEIPRRNDTGPVLKNVFHKVRSLLEVEVPKNTGGQLDETEKIKTIIETKGTQQKKGKENFW